ncbi:hypothetical protein CANMA_001774 [Candida margitis]|uniref:uncharacterized protein n=1 Tax=Candida margitis TaxID=1775924 RepID=UPI0022275C82|nr:uncharacterized protein CANMA_001774 [Candida margitis]KAI5969221.1 hypothetical protein CANMA_001774 [Candida margitis]
MTQALRPPSFMERYQLCRVDNKYYPNFNVTVKYASSINPTVLAHAVHNIIVKNPLLACNYFRTTDDEDHNDYRNYSVRPVDIKFDDLISVQSVPEETYINDQFFAELNKIHFELNKAKPLWKVILNGPYVTIVCSHIYFDGNSGCFFHKDLLGELKELESIEDSLVPLDFIVKAVEITAVPAPVDSTSSLYSLPIWQTVKNVFKLAVAPSWFKPQTKFPLFKTAPIVVDQITHFKVIHIDPTTLKSILTHVKSLNTTLTPWLIAITFNSFSKVHPNNSFDATIPLNGRRYSPADKYQVVVAECTVTLDPPFEIESTSSTISTQLTDELESRDPFNRVALLKLVNVGNYAGQRIGTHSRHTMEISNVGKLPVPQCWFSQGCGFSAHLQMNVASGEDGMDIVFAYVDEVEKDFDEFMINFHKEIENAKHTAT